MRLEATITFLCNNQLGILKLPSTQQCSADIHPYKFGQGLNETEGTTCTTSILESPSILAASSPALQNLHLQSSSQCLHFKMLELDRSGFRIIYIYPISVSSKQHSIVSVNSTLVLLEIIRKYIGAKITLLPFKWMDLPIIYPRRMKRDSYSQCNIIEDDCVI